MNKTFRSLVGIVSTLSFFVPFLWSIASIAKPAPVGKNKPAKAAQSKVKDLGGGLLAEDEVVGKGAEAKPGKMVKVHYTGTLKDGGKKFDSSRDRGQPFEFPLGTGMVIKGWEEGVVGMKVGGKRKLTIPPEKGYGAQGAGAQIPPNATLLFDIELLDVKG